MRFFQVFMLLLLFHGIPTAAFSQSAQPVSETAAKGEDLLEAQAQSADAREKEAEDRAAVITMNLKEWERSGDKTNAKAFYHKQVSLESDLARAELEAAQARGEALKLRAQFTKDGKKTDAKIAASDAEVFRKGKIAVEAIKKAKAASTELKLIEAREIERQAQIALLESRKASVAGAALSPAARMALQINENAEKEKAERARSQLASMEQSSPAQGLNSEVERIRAAEAGAAQRAKAQAEALQKAQRIANEQRAKIEAAQRAQTEQEELQKARAKELELKVAAAKAALQRALDEQEEAHKIHGVAGTENPKAEPVEVAKVNVESVQNLPAQTRVKKTARREIIHNGELFQIYRPRTEEKIEWETIEPAEPNKIQTAMARRAAAEQEVKIKETALKDAVQQAKAAEAGAREAAARAENAAQKAKDAQDVSRNKSNADYVTTLGVEIDREALTPAEQSGVLQEGL